MFAVATTAAVAERDVDEDPPLPKMEHLDRGLVALPSLDGGVFVSWRWLGDEDDDLAFDLYRSDNGGEFERVNDEPITTATSFHDSAAEGIVIYELRPSVGEKARVTADADAEPHSYFSVPLNTPDGYRPGDGSAADLDGDWQYDIILKQEGRSQDNSRRGITDPVLLQAYTLEGQMLWQIDLGRNIRSGAHYTQFQVFDFDSDGRAELICKTADGTTDAAGNVIGDPEADHRNRAGYILKGPEYLTVFDGRTGVAIDTVQYLPQRLPGDDNPTGDQMKSFWGDSYGNRLDRFLAGTAYLDGEHPSAIFSRGYYTRTYVAAYDFDGQHLSLRWLFDSENPEQTQNHQITAPSDWHERRVTHGNHDHSKSFSGQGFHSLSVADVDSDGRDEVVFGAMTIDDDGTGLYTTGWGHGDALHVGDLDPDHPGLEVFGIQERFDDAGAHLHDAATGAPLWKIASVKAADSGGDKGEGPGRGVAINIDPRHPGSECWAAGAGMTGLYDARGNRLSDKRPDNVNFAVWWDGDLLRETLDRNRVSKWNWESEATERLFTADGATSINGTKATPILCADLFGDWREEFILPSDAGDELRIYTTTIPTSHRLRTFMHDPQYRVAIAWQNTAYNQPPHPSFYVDPAMPQQRKPRIKIVPPAVSSDR